MNVDRRRWCVAGGALWVTALVAGATESEPVIEVLDLPGARLELQFAPGFGAGLRAEARRWVERSAAAVAAYFGRFPVGAAEILVVPVDGSGVRSGHASHGDTGLLVRVRLGRDSTPAQLLADWIMVHELIHLAVPRVPRSQNWLHEGIATYVEGVARAQAGLLRADEVWRDWRRAMPQGQPQAGDRGLDHTPTWGRTYWGGAMFCLLADVRIRERSEGRVGLQHALRGVLAAGGGYHSAWPVARILAVGDAAIGQTTLTDLHLRLGPRAEAVDLDALWRRLGVDAGGLRDDAPLAAVRRAILA